MDREHRAIDVVLLLSIGSGVDLPVLMIAINPRRLRISDDSLPMTI